MDKPRIDFEEARFPLVAIPRGHFMWNTGYKPEDEVQLFGEAVMGTAGIDEDKFKEVRVGKFKAAVYVLADENDDLIAMAIFPEEEK